MKKLRKKNLKNKEPNKYVTEFLEFLETLRLGGQRRNSKELIYIDLLEDIIKVNLSEIFQFLQSKVLICQQLLEEKSEYVEFQNIEKLIDNYIEMSKIIKSFFLFEKRTEQIFNQFEVMLDRLRNQVDTKRKLKFKTEENTKLKDYFQIKEDSILFLESKFYNKQLEFNYNEEFTYATEFILSENVDKYVSKLKNQLKKQEYAYIAKNTVENNEPDEEGEIFTFMYFEKEDKIFELRKYYNTVYSYWLIEIQNIFKKK